MTTRRRTPCNLLVFLILLGAAVVLPHAQAQEPSGQSGLSIDQLGWIAGQWEAPVNGGLFEMTYLPPRSASMAGMGRMTRDGVTEWLVFVVIEQTDAGVMKRHMHFEPDYTTWENDGAVEMELVRADSRDVVWAREGERNTIHTTLQLGDDGVMTLRIEGEADGEIRAFEWTLNRVDD